MAMDDTYCQAQPQLHNCDQLQLKKCSGFYGTTGKLKYNQLRLSLAAKGELAYLLQCLINGHQGGPNWPTGSGKGFNVRLLGPHLPVERLTAPDCNAKRREKWEGE